MGGSQCGWGWEPAGGWGRGVADGDEHRVESVLQEYCQECGTSGFVESIFTTSIVRCIPGRWLRKYAFQEVHIMHPFKRDFYGGRMNLLILGFIRPEYDYVSKESLIGDINVDIEVARQSLQREAYVKYSDEKYLLDFQGDGHADSVAE